MWSDGASPHPKRRRSEFFRKLPRLGRTNRANLRHCVPKPALGVQDERILAVPGQCVPGESAPDPGSVLEQTFTGLRDPRLHGLIAAPKLGEPLDALAVGFDR